MSSQKMENRDTIWTMVVRKKSEIFELMMESENCSLENHDKHYVQVKQTNYFAIQHWHGMHFSKQKKNCQHFYYICEKMSETSETKDT